MTLRWRHNDGRIASQITSLTIVYSTVYSGAHQRKHQSSASLAFMRGIHRWPVNSPHKWPVTRKIFPFDDVIMWSNDYSVYCHKYFSICTNELSLIREWHVQKYPIKYVSTSLLWFVLLWLYITLFVDPFNIFTNILQSCFTGIWTIVWLPLCQRSNHEGYGLKLSHQVHISWNVLDRKFENVVHILFGSQNVKMICIRIVTGMCNVWYVLCTWVCVPESVK